MSLIYRNFKTNKRSRENFRRAGNSDSAGQHEVTMANKTISNEQDTGFSIAVDKEVYRISSHGLQETPQTCTGREEDDTSRDCDETIGADKSEVPNYFLDKEDSEYCTLRDGEMDEGRFSGTERTSTSSEEHVYDLSDIRGQKNTTKQFDCSGYACSKEVNNIYDKTDSKNRKIVTENVYNTFDTVKESEPEYNVTSFQSNSRQIKDLTYDRVNTYSSGT